jgi:hypothetical protein
LKKGGKEQFVGSFKTNTDFKTKNMNPHPEKVKTETEKKNPSDVS